METETIPEPGFIEQADALTDESYNVPIEDESYGHEMKPRDHKLLIKLMDMHMDHVKQEVDQINKAFQQEIIEDVSEIIEEQWTRVLDEKLVMLEKHIEESK